jgi:signal transduction histidine kinase
MDSEKRGLRKSFDDARIRNKILAGFAAVVLPLVALAVVTLLASGSVRHHFDTFSDRELPQYRAIDDVEVGTLRLLSAFNRLVGVTLASRYAVGAAADDVADVRREVLQARGDLATAADRLGALPTAGETREYSTRSQIRFVALSIMTQIDSALAAFDGATPNQILARAGSVQEKAESLKEWIDQLQDMSTVDLSEASTTLDATIVDLRSVAIGGIILALLIALAVGLLTANRIARPIQSLRRAAVRLGDGDFAALDGECRTADEIGDLIAAFQETAGKLRDSHAKLARNERLTALGQVAGSVSHELRNPLGTIRNSMGIVRQLTANKGLGIERALDRIERSLERCNAIVADILEFSRVQELNREPTSIDTWLDAMLDEHEVTSAVAVQRELAANAVVMLDRTRFRQVLVNLIDNAVQAMTDPEWAPETDRGRTITIRTAAAGPHVRLAVGDTGPGIPEDKLGKIFEPLFTTKPNGVGLGLPTVRKLVEQHGGTIDVESKAREGTTFTVWLPRQPAQANLQPPAPMMATA